MDITKTLATISAMRTKAILQNQDRVVMLLDKLVVLAIGISKLSDSEHSTDYEERQRLIKSFEEELAKIPNKYKPYKRKN